MFGAVGLFIFSNRTRCGDIVHVFVLIRTIIIAGNSWIDHFIAIDFSRRIHRDSLQVSILFWHPVVMTVMLLIHWNMRICIQWLIARIQFRTALLLEWIQFVR